MRAMLKEVGIASNYVTISTTNRRLLRNFASVGQMNHVILQVPLAGDTLWLECTNPQLPMGYVHEAIAGHDAIEISEAGGRFVTLPKYADTANVLHTTVNIGLSDNGVADIALTQQASNRQYESLMPLLKMDEKERRKAILQMVHVPQTEVGRIDVREAGASITIDTEVKSQKYATRTGQRLFVPVCPMHRGYAIPTAGAGRKEAICRETGFLDEDDITIILPEGFVIEASPKDIRIEQPFGSFEFSLQAEGQKVHVCNRLQMKAGSFDKSLFPKYTEFIRTVSSLYNQNIVLKKAL